MSEPGTEEGRRREGLKFLVFSGATVSVAFLECGAVDIAGRLPQVSVQGGLTTTLALRVTPVRNAKAYEVRISPNGGTTWAHATTSTKARQITVPGLTPGTTYQVRIRAVGGATGCSNWSDPVSHMAT